MISFSNILFRDIGQAEVVDYGSYGIGITRETGIDYGFNPVLYVYENSVVESSIKDNFNFSILPQTLEVIKDFYKGCKCDEITQHIDFNPLPQEVKKLINSISENTKDELIVSIKELFESIFENSYRQIQLAKSYKIKDKDDNTFFAYNEREWRKSYFDLNVIYETNPKGTVNPEFTKWMNTDKPHFQDSEHTLHIPIEKIKYVIVKEQQEVFDIVKYITELYGSVPSELIIDTLDNLKKKED